MIKFYLSEDLKLLNKEEAREKVIKNGGVVREHMTKDVWYFVTNKPDGNSEAFLEAKKLGVLFIDENEFIKMLE